MWFSSGSCGFIVVLYQVAGVLPAQTYDRSWPGRRLTTAAAWLRRAAIGSPLFYFKKILSKTCLLREKIPTPTCTPRSLPIRRHVLSRRHRYTRRQEELSRWICRSLFPRQRFDYLRQYRYPREILGTLGARLHANTNSYHPRLPANTLRAENVFLLSEDFRESRCRKPCRL
jgi:hypothetical protein